MMMPITRASEKPCSTSPPNRNRESTVKKCQAGSQYRPAQRLIDAAVHDVGQAFAAQQLDVLANAVEDDDRVVHRVADQGENGGDDRQRYWLIDQRKRAECDDRVVEAGDNRGRAVDPLETEPEINQHSGQRVQCRQQSLLLELHADLRPDDLHVADAEVGGKEPLLQAGDNRGRSDIAQVRDRFKTPPRVLSR